MAQIWARIVGNVLHCHRSWLAALELEFGSELVLGSDSELGVFWSVIDYYIGKLVKVARNNVDVWGGGIRLVSSTTNCVCPCSL